MVIKNSLLVFCMLLLIANKTHAQPGFLQNTNLSETERRLQLTDDSAKHKNASFTIRPVSEFVKDSAFRRPRFKLTDIGYAVQNNTNLPYGENDESLYPSVGLQQRFSLGMKFQYNHLVIQLQPEFVMAANNDPVGFTPDPGDPNYYPRYYLNVLNKVDLFSRFGTAPIQQFFPGQSSIRYYYKNMSIGVSTENIWWGPGVRNSLVMTNNAPGFAHISFNTARPIKTPIGTVEWEAIFGQLENATEEAPENAIMRNIWKDGIAIKNQSIRKIGGLVFSWQPKWIKNLYLGFAGTVHYYTDSTPKPVPDIGLLSTQVQMPNLGSLFFRYAMPAEHAEIYAEFGRADRWPLPWDLFQNNIPTGYVAGLRKLFPLNRKNQYIEFHGEIARLQLQTPSLIFDSISPFGGPQTNSWYTNSYVAQGYTNNAQLMGASIGPGSNSQTYSLSWVKGFHKIGIQYDRVVRNNDFYYYNYFTGVIDGGYNNRYWTDISWGINGQTVIVKHLLLAFSVVHTKAYNYKWVKSSLGWDPSPASDKDNMRLNFSLRYRF